MRRRFGSFVHDFVDPIGFYRGNGSEGSVIIFSTQRIIRSSLQACEDALHGTEQQVRVLLFELQRGLDL